MDVPKREQTGAVASYPQFLAHPASCNYDGPQDMRAQKGLCHQCMALPGTCPVVFCVFFLFFFVLFCFQS